MKLSEVLEKPWIHLMVDFITKLPVVAGKDVILVVCNKLSKMTYFVATTMSRSKKVDLTYFTFLLIYFSIFYF